MLAHAMRRTTPVIPSRMFRGVLASRWMELCPRYPGSNSRRLALNRVRVASLRSSWSGTSTSLMMPA